MHIRDIFDAHATTFSFEFFPPKTPEAAEQLFSVIRELEPLKPSFVDVTYGAGGGTRELTHDLVMRLHRETSLDPIPHLTTVCHDAPEIERILKTYADAGVSNILALSGDLPRDRQDWDRSQDAFRYAADLVRYIVKFNESSRHTDPAGFGIGVAGFVEGHPATPNRLLEMDYLKAKVDAGADYICTQLFFDNHDFYDFRERCDLAGIRVPILAGIMPITSIKGMKRMAELAAGARIPAALLRAVERAETGVAASAAMSAQTDTPDPVERVGVHWAAEQCRDLLDHQVRGIHFYTLNRSDATRRIYESLGVTDSVALARR